MSNNVNLTFVCPKHGEVKEWIHITCLGKGNGFYCQVCYAEWIRDNFPKLDIFPNLDTEETKNE